MDTSELETLNKLLTKLKEEKLTPPNTPFETWKAMQLILPTPATEILMTSSGKDVLLVERHDDYWNGWHTPGGFMAPGDSIEDTCIRVAQRELGVKVKLIKVVDAISWENDHPYGHPVSLICHCDFKGKPSEGKFFTKTPKNMVSKTQAETVDIFLKYLKIIKQ